MLAQNISDRYQSARQVLQALNSSNTPSYTPTQTPTTEATLAVVPAHNPTSPPSTVISNSAPDPSCSNPLGKILLVLLLAIGGGWWGGRWLQSRSTPPEDESRSQLPSESNGTKISTNVLFYRCFSTLKNESHAVAIA